MNGGENEKKRGGGGGGGQFPTAYEQEEEASNSSSEIQTDDEYAWIPWFTSLKGNEFFCAVDEAYVRDGFNLTGLNSQVPYYEYALDMILDIESNEELLSDDQREMVENDAEHLYGLIHARYVLTARGLHSMLEKYRLCHFGRCPRVLCGGQATLPVGISDNPHEESVKLYCPKCEDVYSTRASRHERTFIVLSHVLLFGLGDESTSQPDDSGPPATDGPHKPPRAPLPALFRLHTLHLRTKRGRRERDRGPGAKKGQQRLRALLLGGSWVLLLFVLVAERSLGFPCVSSSTAGAPP
eukprot:TRINITY_DN66013_c9_g2_i2.p1 TRINITY_DN66013_c9_g2~~TRINITY_DN66013_c9_g2_i2.p1  ORF type:complete len:315 (-),score=88.58 TRINITY_DN66013_c9_g2_i2:148-1038(-)